MANYKSDASSDILKIMKALGDGSRLRAFMALKDRELCVCQIVELLELAPSTVSKHLSVLKTAGLVDSNKRGRWIYYSLSEKALDDYKNLIDSIADCLERDAGIKNDAGRMKQILRINPEELCKMQLNN